MIKILKTPEAEQDLLEIWEYTAIKWGATKAGQYLGELNACLEEIRHGRKLLRPLSPLKQQLQFARCGHHVIFFWAEENLTIIAVLHERMSLLAKLKKRLG